MKPHRLSLETLKRIDEISTWFDRVVRNGDAISIEELLEGFGGWARKQLLLDLLLLELEYDAPTDLNETAAAYFQRFPKDRLVIRKAIDKHRDHHVPEMEIASLITFAPAESPEHDTTITLATPYDSQPSPLPSLEAYELLRELGRGGMGVVYRARHRQTGHHVAVKMLLTGAQSTGEQIKRFLREARTASKLQHPNIVAVHETGFHDGAPFIVMDYVDGLDLEALAQNSPLTQMEAALLIKTAATAIHYAHAQDVVHRDLKPSNLLLDEQVRLRITDFGLARELSHGETLTQTGSVLGTPAYMPPEQALADREQIGPRSDVYSLGAVLFFLLTGRPPFRGDAAVKVLQQVVTARPPNPSSLDSSISTGLSAISLKCLEKNPSRRYQTAAELAADLERWQRLKPVRARKPVIQSLLRRMAPKQKRRVSPKWLTLTAAVACLLIAGILIIHRGPKPTPVRTDPQPIETVLGDGFTLRTQHSFAYAGQPYGVGKVSFDVEPDESGRLWTWYHDQPARIQCDSCTLLYPSFEFVQTGTFDDRNHFTAWFLVKDPPASGQLVVDLFAGDTSIARNLKLTMCECEERTRTLTRNDWWRARLANCSLTPSAELQLVNNFLLNMLQRRWNQVRPEQLITVPEAFQPVAVVPDNANDSDLEQKFERMFGTLIGFEAVRLAMMELPPIKVDNQAGRSPIPPDLKMNLANPVIDQKADAPQKRVEELAFHVPMECFYLHCNSIENYLWIRDIVQGWGGSLAQVVAVPALDDHLRQRIERQLVFDPHQAKESRIDDLLDDCALIGLDPYFRDGAAIGILFQAKSDEDNSRLAKLIETQRNAEDLPGDVSVRFQGHPAWQLKQDHNEIRSWYLQFGHYHLITNSEKLAQRFVITAKNPKAESLGSLPEYQAALSYLDHCAAWIYTSAPFIRNITSPEFVIEVERRRRAARELRLLSLAVAAAKAEGVTGATWEQLQDLGFLAEDFGRRFDASSPVIGINEDVFDSERGRLGTFEPIMDTILDNNGLSVTQNEIDAYTAYKHVYEAQWTTASPVLLSFDNKTNADGDNIIVDIRTHFPQQKDSLLAKLSQHLPKEPVKGRMQMLDDELLGVWFSVQSIVGTVQLHVGLLDDLVECDILHGELNRKALKYRNSTYAKQNFYALATPVNAVTRFFVEQAAHEFDLLDDIGLSEAKPGNQQPAPSVPPNRVQQQSRLKKVPGDHPPVSIAPASTALTGAFSTLFTGNSFFVANGKVPDLLSFLSTSPLEHALKVNAPVDKSKTLVLSNQVEIKQRVEQEWQLGPAERPAHLSLQLKDVQNSNVIDYLETYTFLIGRRLSAADAAVLNRLAADLNLPPDVARTRLEGILGGEAEMTELTCPAGGVYVLSETGSKVFDTRYWKSTGWQQPSLYLETGAPKQYKYPFLNWVRELSLESTLEPEIGMLSSHLELTLRAAPTPPKIVILPEDPTPTNSPEEIGVDSAGDDDGDRDGEGDDPPALKIFNNNRTPLQFRYQKLLGTWSTWDTLPYLGEATFSLDQSLRLEYRYSNRSGTVLVGSERYLKFDNDGWKSIN